MDTIVLGYSGGLETSVAIPWLAETYGVDVVTVTVDLGQGVALEDIRARALAVGARRAHVIDAREEFARDFILPALQAGAIYEGRYPLATALGRPLIARHLVDIARIEGARAIAHACSDNENDRVRLETAARALDPDLRVIAAGHESGLTHGAAVDYARRRGLPVPPAAESVYSVDANLWGRSIRLGGLEDSWREAPEEIFQLTKSPAEAPDAPAYVEIEFDRGAPTKVNDVELPVVELLTCLETIAGAHGVGRVDFVENQVGGVKSREVYEAPAAVPLHVAHADLQTFVTPRDLERLTSDLAVTYADLVYHGSWYSTTREAIDALVAKVQTKVTGTIRLKLFKGDCRVVGRRSPFAFSDRGSQAREETEPGGPRLWHADKARRQKGAPSGAFLD